MGWFTAANDTLRLLWNAKKPSLVLANIVTLVGGDNKCFCFGFVCFFCKLFILLTDMNPNYDVLLHYVKNKT